MTFVVVAGGCGNLQLSFSVQDDHCSMTHLHKRGECVDDIGKRDLQPRGSGQDLGYLVDSPDRDVRLVHGFDRCPCVAKPYLVLPIPHHLTHGNTSGVVRCPSQSAFLSTRDTLVFTSPCSIANCHVAIATIPGIGSGTGARVHGSSELEEDTEAAPRIIPLDLTTGLAQYPTGAALHATVGGDFHLALVGQFIALGRADAGQREQVGAGLLVSSHFDMRTPRIDQVAILVELLLNA
ncbi:hypothetical protein MPL3356_250026 [Mesorhizobium plurifarium]|uniref:Uncharacterized protein n=1 Tax=Mesorhizobium plurifarium TaxID=69974 RepID=A0A090DNE1_MESPL|nr:hypothetical protein MPL3356_250026 [Mesorhizobium plurifarium]